FERSSKELFVQARDKDSNDLVWQLEVIDADPESKGTVKVKITAPVQPICPEPVQGFPFAPIAFEGLTINPYISQSSGRLEYPVKASGIAGSRGAARSSAAQHKDAA